MKSFNVIAGAGLAALSLVSGGRLVAAGSARASRQAAAASRPVKLFNYDELTRMSDLVVIATPVERRELSGLAEIPGIKRLGKPAMGIRIHTSFRTQVIFKGKAPVSGKVFTVLHMREANPPVGVADGNAPSLVDFAPGSGKAYLMFLRLGPDDVSLSAPRYEPVLGQTDPALCIHVLPNPVLESP